jgi:pyrroloquinoline quinone biosynthesis protein B
MNRRRFLDSLFFSFLSFKTISLLQREKKSLKNHSYKSDILIKVMGTAQDGGIPHAGCYCENCQRARKEPAFSRLISSLSIIDLKENKFYLIDATPDIRLQLDILYRFNKKRTKRFYPDGIFLTHAHIGHYTGLIFFGYESLATKNLPVYCSSRMKNFLMNSGPWSQLIKLRNIKIQIFESEKELLISPQLSITPIKVPHRDEYTDTFGFLIAGKKKKLLYIPDIQSWERWDRLIVEEIKRIDIALIDGTFYSSNELPERDLSKIGHPFIETTIKKLEKVKGNKKIYFTHLNHSNLALNPYSMEKKEIIRKGFDLASEGMEFYI